jgi:multidrug efflux system outer membrane protein
MAGCKAGPDYHTPKVAAVAAKFSQAAAVAQSTNSTAKWWTAFGDPLLTRLIEEAMQGNHDVRTATEHLRGARALRRQAQWGFAPSGMAAAGVQRKLESTVTMPGASRDFRNFDLFDAGFDATWELDVFGRVRRQNEVSAAILSGAAALRDEVLLAVAAETARNYFELRDGQRRLTIATRNAQIQEESLRLATLRWEAGKGSEFDAAMFRAQMHATKASLANIETGIKQSMHRIAVLTGRGHTEWIAQLEAPSPSYRIPKEILLDDPSIVLRRRPDVRLAERALAASTAQIGVAAADLFPRVTFNGHVAVQAKSLDAVTGADAQAYGFGPRISWAALDLGRIKAIVDATRAGADAQLASYEKTVLTALEETDNALLAYGQSQTRSSHFKEALSASRRAHEIAKARYEEGVADMLQLLEAERRLLEVETALTQSETATATCVLAIYKSLGAGWEEFPVLKKTADNAPEK